LEAVFRLSSRPHRSHSGLVGTLPEQVAVRLQGQFPTATLDELFVFDFNWVFQKLQDFFLNLFDLGKWGQIDYFIEFLSDFDFAQ
jgi:hypothetical protein